MKVDVLSGASRNEGGLLGAVLGLTRSLQQTNVDVRLISHSDPFTAKDLPLWAPVPVEFYAARGPLLSSFKLRKILEASSADMIHVHGIWLDRQWAALQWQKRTGKPVVISPHGMLDPWAVQNSAWKKKLIGKLFADESLKRSSCIHALCQSEAASVRAYGLQTPIAVIPNGIELPLGKTIEKPEGKKKLLFLGRIHPKKGLAELIAGWAQAKPQDWELLIAGWDDGNYEPALKGLVVEAGIGDSVKFLGPVFGDDKDALMRQVDAFVLPSFSEGLPMSVLEAWSYRLPVLMTDFCNIPEGFEVDAALRLEPDAAAISNGLEKLFSMNAVDLETMGSKGRKLVEDRFTWERIVSEMKSVYEWCIGGDKPACIQES
ncbi:MAG: glycosyltransferase [Pontiella sp.]